jgi:hypothetical protein
MQSTDNLFARMARENAARIVPAASEGNTMSETGSTTNQVVVTETPLQEVESILLGVAPQLAAVGINAALGAVPGGTAFGPLADEVFSLIVEGITKQASPSGQAKIAAKVSAVTSGS